MKSKSNVSLRSSHGRDPYMRCEPIDDIFASYMPRLYHELQELHRFQELQELQELQGDFRNYIDFRNYTVCLTVKKNCLSRLASL